MTHEGRHVDPSRPWQLQPRRTNARLGIGLISTCVLIAGRVVASFARSQSEGFVVLSVVLWIFIAALVAVGVIVEVVLLQTLTRMQKLRDENPESHVYLMAASSDFLRTLLSIDPGARLRAARYYSLVIQGSAVSVWVGAAHPVRIAQIPANRIAGVRARDSRSIRSARGQVELTLRIDDTERVVQITLVHINLVGHFALDYADCDSFASTLSTEAGPN